MNTVTNNNDKKQAANPDDQADKNTWPPEQNREEIICMVEDILKTLKSTISNQAKNFQLQKKVSTQWRQQVAKLETEIGLIVEKVTIKVEEL